jgi:hypothetical protein
VQFDFGSAPAPYPTTLLNNGARHAVVGPFGLRLGSTVDTEPDGDSVSNPDGDIADDGVTFLRDPMI